MKNNNVHQGFIAITSVLLMGSMIFLLGLGMFLSAQSERDMAATAVHVAAARAAKDACLVRAAREVSLDPAWGGEAELLLSDTAACSSVVTASSSDPSSWSLLVTGSSGEVHATAFAVYQRATSSLVLVAYAED